MRPGDVLGGELRTRHLVEQRLELVVVVAVHQHHVDPLVAQLLRTGDAGQSAAQDEDPIGRRVGPVHQRHLLESVGEDDPAGGFDEGEVGEGLGEVAEVAGAVDFELFGVEPER